MKSAPWTPEVPPHVQRFALAESRPEPWKNGRGVTRTLLTDASAGGHAPGELPNWSWRISVAELQENGPFSVFEDVDRTLILLSGGDLILNRPKGAAVLDRPGAQVSFRGEEYIQATITRAPAQALNLMTRRGSVRSTVHVVGEQHTAMPEPQASVQRHHARNALSLTTVAFVGAGRYRIQLYEKSGRVRTMILPAHEGARIDRTVYPPLQVELISVLDVPPHSGTAASPWLILITLESITDSLVPTAP
jgi:environmental stress-induced protein Ves